MQSLLNPPSLKSLSGEIPVSVSDSFRVGGGISLFLQSSETDEWMTRWRQILNVGQIKGPVKGRSVRDPEIQFPIQATKKGAQHQSASADSIREIHSLFAHVKILDLVLVQF